MPGETEVKARGRGTIALQLVPVFLILAAVVVLLIFDHSGKSRSILGLFSAGVAIALTRVITAIAGFFVILTSRAFRVGDRIVIGGVRGDVIKLGYIRTTILEMGQPPPVQSDEPAMWVEGREYTGRVVTITNDKIFDQPVRRYFVAEADLEPRVFFKLTDNWLELAVRFIVPTHGVRFMKDRMSRDIIREFDAAGMQVASATFEIVGLPEVRVALGARP